MCPENTYLLFLLIFCSKFGGGCADFSFENLVKIGGILKTAVGGDKVDPALGLL